VSLRSIRVAISAVDFTKCYAAEDVEMEREGQTVDELRERQIQ